MADIAMTPEEVQRTRRLANGCEDLLIEVVEGNREVDDRVKLAASTVNSAINRLRSEGARQAMGVQLLLRFATPKQIEQVVERSLPDVYLALTGKGEVSKSLDAEPKPRRMRHLAQKSSQAPASQ
jgi:hypothetical protein